MVEIFCSWDGRFFVGVAGGGAWGERDAWRWLRVSGEEEPHDLG